MGEIFAVAQLITLMDSTATGAFIKYLYADMMRPRTTTSTGTKSATIYGSQF